MRKPGPLPVGGQGDRAEERGEGGRPEGDEAARVRQQDRARRRAGAQHSVSGGQRVIRLSRVASNLEFGPFKFLKG